MHDDEGQVEHIYREKTDKRILKKNPWRDYRLHVTVLILVVVAELIGTQKIPITGDVAITIMPLIYTIVLGLIFYLDKRITWIKRKQARIAEGAMMLFIGVLIAKLAVSSGQSIHLIFEMGPALILQEIGHLATILVIIGTVIGTIFISFLVTLSLSFLPLHPYAFAMASGVGSASMNAAAIGPTLAAFPGLESQIEAFAGFSNLLSFCVGIYIVIFLALPLTERVYRWLEPKIGKDPVEKEDE